MARFPTPKLGGDIALALEGGARLTVTFLIGPSVARAALAWAERHGYFSYVTDDNLATLVFDAGMDGELGKIEGFPFFVEDGHTDDLFDTPPFP